MVVNKDSVIMLDGGDSPQVESFVSGKRFGMTEHQKIRFKYPGWQKPYAEALVEVDKEKLPALIAKAAAAIQRRLDKLSQGDADRAERRAILDAQALLRALKKETPDSPSGA